MPGFTSRVEIHLTLDCSCRHDKTCGECCSDSFASIGLDDTAYGTRTKAPLICRRTKDVRAVQWLLGQSKLESTVRYLGIDVDDALVMVEQTLVCDGIAACERSLAGRFRTSTVANRRPFESIECRDCALSFRKNPRLLSIRGEYAAA